MIDLGTDKNVIINRPEMSEMRDTGIKRDAKWRTTHQVENLAERVTDDRCHCRP